MAEIERVKRSGSDSLDAYELVLQAQADVYSRALQRCAKALLLLERALALDPTYGLAHAYAAECHHSIFLRGGLQEAHRTASIRHAESAIAYGHDDASALAFAGHVIELDKHDRAAAFTAFDAALSVSPSSALTYILGSATLAFAGEAERAIEWAERGLRLSPFDVNRVSAFLSMSFAHFQRGRYGDAADAARKAIQASPAFSLCHMALAGSLAKIGQLEEAKAAGTRVLELQPSFGYGTFLRNVGAVSSFVQEFGDALRAAGLPE